jgi:hypothetical protein
MVEIDNLGDIGQGRVGRPQGRVVCAGAAMQQEQCRLLPHGWTVRHELRALDIEEQPHAVDEHMHGQISLVTNLAGELAADPFAQATCLFRQATCLFRKEY